MYLVKMPRLGVTMQSGKVQSWCKQQGDTVEKGDVLFEMESEKSILEIEAQASGVLRKILVPEDEEVDVNTIIAVIASADEVIDEGAFTVGEGAPLAASEPIIQEASRTCVTPVKVLSSMVSPRARRLAQELGVDLEKVQPEKGAASISEEDIRRHARDLSEGNLITLSHVQQAMSKHIAKSWADIPHFTQIVSVNMKKALALKAQGVGINDLLVSLVARTAVEHPLINARLEDGKIFGSEDVNVGVAVATNNGLMVPVLKHAQNRSLEDLSAELHLLVDKAKSGKLSPSETRDGTLTFSNLGSFGIETGTPIINSPQSTLVFAGAIINTPIVDDNGDIISAPIMKLSVSFDHRFIDGATAARFTSALKAAIESLSEIR